MVSFVTQTSHPLPVTISAPECKVLFDLHFQVFGTSGWSCRRSFLPKLSRSHTIRAQSVSREDSNALGFDVSFPEDYTELLDQAKVATELALKDGKRLMEIEFPTSGLESVPGDGEGGIEMTGSMQLMREFCDCLVAPENERRTRIVLSRTMEGTEKEKR